MKLLFLAALDPCLAQGHSVHVRRLTEALAARGHRVDVLARDNGGTLVWTPPGRLLRLARTPLPKAGQLQLELETVRALRRWISVDRPDAVLARCEALAWAPLLVPRSVPLAVESNASLVGHQLGRRGARAHLVRRLEGAVLRRASRIGVVAPGLAALHVRYHRIPESRMFVVPNGAWIPPVLAPAEIVAIRRSLGARESDCVFALAGAATWRTDFGALLLAVEREAAARLWVIGDGELLADWKGRVAASSARERIDFHGPLEEEEAARRSQAAQAVVAPYAETCVAELGADPLKVLLGMACGRPVLASGVGEDPPLDTTGAGRRVEAGEEGWIRGLGGFVSDWAEAGRPLSGWPPDADGAGPCWIRENRTWDRSAALWERELLAIAEAGRGPSGSSAGSSG